MHCIVDASKLEMLPPTSGQTNVKSPFCTYDLETIGSPTGRRQRLIQLDCLNVSWSSTPERGQADKKGLMVGR